MHSKNMVEIPSALTTTLIGMIGVVLGAIVSNYINSKIARKNSKQDILFNKRLEYFERIIQAIENNTKLYLYSLRTIEKKTNKNIVETILKKMKKHRNHFDAKTSPLYVDTRLFAEKIKEFVSIEKVIFLSFENLLKNNEEKEQIIVNIRKNIKALTNVGNSLIFHMRENLAKE